MAARVAMLDDGVVPCYRCARIQTDPVKGASPWSRGVLKGDQILVCPECQQEHPEWASELDRCPHCASTRLSVVMGSVVCRSCNFDYPAH